MIGNLETLVQLALEEDLGLRGDVTSAATIPAGHTIHGQITAKGDGVIAGLPVVEAVYAALGADVVVTPHTADGDRVQTGDVIVSVQGDAHAVLTGERTALNFLQRLSGIATQTARYVAAVEGTGAQILDTRKTTPAYRELEKYAVRTGGGVNHRTGLYDMVLIKDNHIDAAGGVQAAIEAALKYTTSNPLPLVVEVKDMDELRTALAYPVTRILLDNMTLEQMREAVAITAGRVPLEASGGVTLAALRAIAETGVDCISVGALTHSAAILDLSMRLVREQAI